MTPATPDDRGFETAADEFLTRLWCATTPAEPDEAAWSETLARVRGSLSIPVPERTPRQHRFGYTWLMTAAGLAVAAALLVAAVGLLVSRSLLRPDPVNPNESLEVASAEDVEIVSIDGRDQDLLVVGRAPLREPLVLAAPDDVRLNAVEPDGEGRFIVLPVVADVEAPMIVAALPRTDPK
jgi:hypothetical protein